MTQWDPIQSLIENCRISQHNEAVVAEFVLRYYREMNDVERLFLLRDTLSEEEHTSILKLGIAAKLQVHNRYWEETDDEYWKPCSLSSSEEYSISNVKSIEVKTDFRGKFLVEVKYPLVEHGPGFQDTIYLVEHRACGEESKLVIVDCFV